MSEEWRPVVGYEGHFEVSDLGRVRSLPRMRSGPCGRPTKVCGRILMAQTDRKGYKRLILNKDGKRLRLVHRLVAESFLGPGTGKDVNHKNGDPGDNRLVNIEWATRQQNILHKHRVLGRGRGQDNNHAKLTEAHAIEALGLANTGLTLREAAERYGVGIGCIWNLWQRKTWRHLDGYTSPEPASRARAG